MISSSLLGLIVTAVAAGPAADPWDREYTAAESKAGHVIAVWQFSSGAELEDSSGHGHTLELFGARAVAGGRFGGGLESYPGWPVEDKRHAAVAKAAPSLSPSGAFTIDAWLKPSKDLPAKASCHLLCKKYVSNNDYQLLLTAPEGTKRRLHFVLGFGEDSEAFFSEAQPWPADVWQHIALTYDGAGTVRFFQNGEPIGGRMASGRRSLSPGPLPLSIGDRTGSNYSGFAGVMDQVRISKGVREFGRLRIELELERRVFVRKEQAPRAVIRATNLRGVGLKGGRLIVSMSGAAPRELALGDLGPNASTTVDLPVDTGLRPDLYELRLEAEFAEEAPGAGKGARTKMAQSYPIRIVGRPIADRMPVVQWGVGGISNIVKELPKLKEVGFTHCLGLDVDEFEVWRKKEPQTGWKAAKEREVAGVLDTALANDLRVLISLSPGHTLESITDGFRRVDRNGKVLPNAGVDGLYPDVQTFCENVGESAARLYAKFPAFDGALVHTELRDAAALSFGAVDREAYRRASGQEIPPEAAVKWGLTRKAAPGIPADGVIADDFPLYRYFQWFWRKGDGWPALNSATARGFQRGAGGRTDLWTFHDPAVRVASVFGSGGDVDVLSQWTYSYPEPLRLGLPTDELFAMVRGASRPQRVMKMTQLIWYRSQTAPAAKGDAEKIRSAWDDHDPDAAYITIAPMHLREAFWTKISRPIQGIMYHGWPSLVPTDEPTGYRYTHPETQHELRRLVRDVVEPLGPMLRRTPASRNDVAFLESFAAQMFASRGSYGWSHNWTGDCYQVLQHAGLQADVLYDESVGRFGLDGYKVLVIADGDVLTRSVADRILAFQKRGGIVVADDRLASAIKPDIRLTPLVRKKKGDVDGAGLLELAATLKRELTGRYEWPVETSNSQVIPYRRTFGGGDAKGSGMSTYVFLVNDRREFGSYVGQHGMVQEVGRQSEATVTVRGQDPGSVVYDLLEHRRVEVKRGSGGEETSRTWPVTLGPCEGRVFVATPRAIATIEAKTAGVAALSKTLKCTIAVLDERGEAIPAVLPLHVELRDPDGRAAEFSGYHAAVGGRLELTFEFAANDLAGPWQLRVSEGASGITLNQELVVGRAATAANGSSPR